MPDEVMFITGTTSYQKIFEEATKNNWDNRTVNYVVEGLLQQSRGKTKRTFAYATTLAAAKPECAPTATRSFAHTDWIDGESVVQAEETSLEEGFNRRFHLIEDDIDALIADIGRMSGCLGALRAELAARLDEIRTELNLINGDIADCCNTGSSGPYQPIDPGIYTPVEPPIRWPDDRWPWPGTGGGGWIPPRGGGGLPPRGGPIPYPVDPRFGGGRYGGGRFGVPGIPRPDEYVRPWVNVGDDPLTVDGANILRSTEDPNVGIIAGMQGRRIATDKFGGKDVEVWSTPMGLIMTPNATPAPKDMSVGWTNPHVEAAADFRNWTRQNEARIKDATGGRQLTIAQFEEQFGEERLPGGTKVGAFLEQLPSGAQIKSPDALGDMVVDRAMANVVRDGAATETIIGMVGLNSAENTKTMEVTVLTGVNAAVGGALRELGVNTVDDLAKTDLGKLDDKLNGLRGGAAPGLGGLLQAQARVLGGLMPGRQ